MLVVTNNSQKLQFQVRESLQQHITYNVRRIQAQNVLINAVLISQVDKYTNMRGCPESAPSSECPDQKVSLSITDEGYW